MANEEHLAILKKGVQAWNEWRKRNPGVPMDLRHADLKRADLRGVDFSKARLRGANLREVPLGGATHLMGADLSGANLGGADLSGAFFGAANLRKANLTQAKLKRANLFATRLQHVNLSGADMRGVALVRAYFKDADLREANLSDCLMDRTVMVAVDLSSSKGLETVRHEGPSSIGIDTIYLSKGKIPKVFLRGAGVPDPFIANMKALVAAMEPIQFYSCFISYSSKDEKFAKRLHADLQQKHVRCWFDREDMKIGDRIRRRIGDAIRTYDKLLLVLSKGSVKSPWVEREVEAAFEKERKQKRTVLFPIRLDDAVTKTKEAWAADLRRMRHIGDFQEWESDDKYKEAFGRLMGDLKRSGQKE